jgi:hypothetical protein
MSDTMSDERALKVLRSATKTSEILFDLAKSATVSKALDHIAARLAQPAAAVPDIDELRLRFEKWASKRHGVSTERWADSGKYRYCNTNDMWECWMEAQALASKAGVPTAEHYDKAIDSMFGVVRAGDIKRRASELAAAPQEPTK